MFCSRQIADEIPDDEEVSGELEFLDEFQLFFDLKTGTGLQFVRLAAVAIMKACPRMLAQKRVHGLAFGHRVAREFVAEIVEGEFQARGKFQRVADGFGQVGEKLLHLLRGFQKALGVAGEQASGSGESVVMANGGESVAQLAGFGSGVADSVCGQQWKIQRAGDVDCGAVAGFFFALEMTLQFDVDVFRPENADELIDLAASFVDAAVLQGCSERAFAAAGEADEARGVFL